MDVEVDLRQVVYALSDTLVLVGMNDFYHGKRVGLMAVEVARCLGMKDDGREELFDTGLLHACGLSSTAVHQHLVAEMDWAGSQGHCEQGYGLLEGMPRLARMAPVVLYHHTHWQDFTRMDVAPTWPKRPT